MTIDHLKDYIVCVNGGSGVIFQPLDTASSYILTAKHVLKDIGKNGEVIIRRYVNGQVKPFDVQPFKLREAENYFSHPGKDIAILKIDRLSGAENLLRLDDLLAESFSFILIGFPEMRRGEANFIDQIREDTDLRILGERSDGKREGKFPDNPSLEELLGQSGGGIFCISNNYACLAGIQNKVPAEEEQQGRIEFSPMFNFDEIVEKYADKLESIVPPFIKSFTFLQADAFNLPQHIRTKAFIEQIKIVLVQKALSVGSDFCPRDIIGCLTEDQLRISGQKREDIYIKSLWLLWLEMLTILTIIKGRKVVKQDFDEIFTQIRLFHSLSDQDFWLEHLGDIALTNFGDLKTDGTVVVSSAFKADPQNYILDKRSIVGQIDQVKFRYQNTAEMPYGSEDQNVAQASDFPYDKFQFVHMDYFKQKLIIDDCADYAGMDLNDMLNLLQKKYGSVIK